MRHLTTPTGSTFTAAVMLQYRQTLMGALEDRLRGHRGDLRNRSIKGQLVDEVCRTPDGEVRWQPVMFQEHTDNIVFLGWKPVSHPRSFPTHLRDIDEMSQALKVATIMPAKVRRQP